MQAQGARWRSAFVWFFPRGDAHRAVTRIAVEEREIRETAVRDGETLLHQIGLATRHRREPREPRLHGFELALAREIVGIAAKMLMAAARAPELRVGVELECQSRVASGHHLMRRESIGIADVA